VTPKFKTKLTTETKVWD